MKDIQVFEIAPALGNPWYIESIDLDADRNRDIRVDFKKRLWIDNPLRHAYC